MLGPFELDVVVGEGAAGRVWRAIHRPTETPVAVKVVTDERARGDVFLRRLRAEARAVARLDHPGVVRLLDTGPLPDRSGAWLAMELAQRSLVPALGVTPWATALPILGQLLHALGHAHARGVLHRDLKPANVLVHAGWPSVKLADFGVAALLPLDTEVGAFVGACGTPACMAPEQVEARWRDQGPWTDLYGLGCLAWMLVTGAPPFRATSSIEILSAHLQLAPPPLDAAVPVPEGLEGWLRRLLEKHPSRRFRRAADALLALERLGPATGAVHRAPAVSAEIPTVRWSTSHTRSDGAEPVPLAEPPAAVEPAPVSAPAWTPRMAVAVAGGPGLAGVGLSLVGLRTPRLVGRRALRDALWAALGRVHAHHRARALVLAGPSGVGKTRLATWLTEEAHAAGLAGAVHVVHDRSPAPDDGLWAAVRRYHRGAGLDTAALARRLERAGEDDAAVLAGLCGPEGGPGVGRTERFTVLERWLRRRTAWRPLVLVVDDAQWGAEAVAFVAWLVGRDVPVLVVLTVRSEELSAGAAHGLATLDAERHDVGPLAPEAQRALLRDVLPLAPATVGRLLDCAGGSPMVAVHLVGELVARGHLAAGPAGFAADAGAVAASTDLPDLWRARVERLTAGVPEPAVRALERAAVLGLRFDRHTWAAACAVDGLPHPRALLDRLLDARLLDVTEHGWAFVHALWREAWIARSGTRAAVHHAACAVAVVAARGARWHERLAHHRVGAGDRSAALPHLALGAQEAVERSDFDRAVALLDDLEVLLDTLGVPAADPRRVDALATRAWAAKERGDLVGSVAHARRGLALANRIDDPSGRVRCSGLVANILQQQGKVDEALALLASVDDDVARVDSVRRRVSHPRLKAICHFRRGDFAAAERFYREALTVPDAPADDRAYACAGLSYLLLYRGGPVHRDEALALVREADALHRSIHNRYGEADCANALGEILRHAGDLEGAEAAYARSVDRFRAVGSRDGRYAELNLHLVWALRNDPRAGVGLERIAATFLEDGIHFAWVGARAVHLLAAVDDPPAWDAALADVDAGRVAHGVVDADVAFTLERAAAAQTARGDTVRAARAVAIAEAMRAAMRR